MGQVKLHHLIFYPLLHPHYHRLYGVTGDDMIHGAPRAHLYVVGMLRFMSDINPPSLPNPLYSVIVSVSVFMFLSTVFHFINSSDNSPLSRSVLPVLFLPYWSFQHFFLS